jgi:excisionase family DNA binding protein
MTSSMRILRVAPDEKESVLRALDMARRPGAWLVDAGQGAEGVSLPPALVELLAAAREPVARSAPLVMVARDAEVSPAEAARILGVSRQYVDRLTSSGRLPFRRVPGSTYRRIPVEALVRRMREGEEVEEVEEVEPAPSILPPSGDGEPAHPGTPIAATARGQRRRERLITATAELVATKGFHGTSLLEIGAAAGVTGSAIYRHFENKTQLLVAVFDRVLAQLLNGSARVIESGLSPEETLDALLLHHVRQVLGNPSVFGVYLQEAANLPREDLGRLRRNQRTYVLRWAQVLSVLQPDLARDEARVRVQATFALLNSPANFPRTMPDETLTNLLVTMGRAALTTPR